MEKYDETVNVYNYLRKIQRVIENIWFMDQ